MASKYWFVVDKQPRSQTDIVTNESVSRELDLIYKFLRFKIQAPRAPPENNLDSLDPFQDFEINRRKNEGLWSWLGKGLRYQILTGKDRPLLEASQRDTFCFCWKDPYEDVIINDLQGRPIIYIQKPEIEGYISKKMSFIITTHQNSTNSIGKISRTYGLLNGRPKYDIFDAHGQMLFTFTTEIGDKNSKQPNYVEGKSGKTAFLQEEKDGIYKLRIYTFCSKFEKAMLLSLVIIHDLAKYADAD